MKRKPKSLNVNPETAAEKARQKQRIHDANSKKRRVLKNQAERVGEKEIWKALSVKDKESMILNWSVNGGVIAGKRYTHSELSKAMGLNPAQLSKILAVCQNSFEKMFETTQQMKQTVFAVAAKAIHQLQDNRARAVMHNDILDEELTIIRKQLKDARKKVAKNPTEQNRVDNEVNRLMTYFRSVSYQKLESIRLLLDATEGSNSFLAMFTSQKTGKMPGFQPEEAPDPAGSAEYVDVRSAIQLLEDHGGSPLPSHRDLVFDQGSKNPNAGFEILKAQDPTEDE